MYRNRTASCVLLLVIACGAFAQPAKVWDFENGAAGWSGAGQGCGIVAEPDAPGNHAYQIVATRPHHTRLVLEDSRATPNFVVSLRVKMLEWEGAPPTVYVYGRNGKDGFRALNLGATGGRVFCYCGQDEPSLSVGKLDTVFSQEAGWTHLAFACFEDYVLGKAWAPGSPEPAWQVEGRDARNLSGEFALGVWTSPREPSKATVLFDDVRFAPLRAEDLEAWGIRPGPWPRLDPASLPGSPGVFRATGRLGIASACTAMAFDLATGAMANLVDTRTGRDFVAPEVKRPLFKVALTKPCEGKRVDIDARAFASVEVHSDAQDVLQIDFAHLSSLAMTAHVTASLLDNHTIGLDMRIENASDWCIASIVFPIVPAPPVLGDDDSDDALVLPWSSGAVLPSPGRESVSHTADYPGAAFAQFHAFCDETAGAYFAMQDPDGHCKRFHLHCVANQSVSITPEHLLPELPGREVALPYPTVVRTFQGDWRAAAAIYKAWAANQPWCAKRLVAREDIPQFLKEGSGIIITGIQNPEGRAQLLGERLEKLPDLMDAYRERTGLKHMIFVPYGWENRGTWAGINYLPAVPSNDIWREANAMLEVRGHRTAFLTSGFWWVTKRQETSNGPAFDDTADFEQRKAMCITKADGTTWQVDNYNRLKEHGSWRGLSVKLCHGSREARDTMKRVFLDVAGLGVPLISFDQEIGGCQTAPCYGQNHGHPPGYGAWMWTDFRDVCADIRREGKPIQPELGLFLERVSELAIPYMATYWSRQFGTVDVGVRRGQGIGLFSYLYHEYVTAIGAACVQGQGQHGTRPHPGLRCYVLANNLVRGLIPGPFLHEVPLETDKEWESLVSRAYFAFCRPYAHFAEYLLLGETCPPIEVRCADTALWFWRRDAARGKPIRKGGPPLVKVPIALPAVAVGSFIGEDGSTAAFLANTTPEPQAAVAIIPKDKRVIVYREERTEEKRFDASDTDLPVPLTFDPFGVRVVVMR